jgi:hypothetical protein
MNAFVVYSKACECYGAIMNAIQDRVRSARYYNAQARGQQQEHSNRLLPEPTFK